MNLSDIFAAVAHKQLTAVDLPDMGSNQHELNGTTVLRGFFGTNEPTRGAVLWHRFADDEEPTADSGDFTFYDARARSADRTGRSEWRFYYEGHFLDCAGVGDTLVLARTPNGKLFGLVFQRDSAWLRAAKALFGIADSSAEFDAIPGGELTLLELAFTRQRILNELQLELAVPVVPTDETLVLERFGPRFPTTREMSEFAREQVHVDARRPDETLVRWLEREEQLFRALENHIIGDRLRSGFDSVDVFVEYSLSVQNRRKSRMGFALQNHLQELFDVQGLRYTAQARTEANNRPDFIFPGQSEYHDASFDTTLLVMLGVKSTSKDRWRQILTEADRISEKHLCTLEAGISARQTQEMQRQRLTLVLPEALHETYTDEQRPNLLRLAEFIEFVRAKQTK
jgi:hypothetical protein